MKNYPTSVAIKCYREKNQCSLLEAKKVVTRKYLAYELKESKDMESLIKNILEILDFEFGGYTND